METRQFLMEIGSSLRNVGSALSMGLVIVEILQWIRQVCWRPVSGGEHPAWQQSRPPWVIVATMIKPREACPPAIRRVAASILTPQLDGAEKA